MTVIFMGVCGCGKSTVGQRFAEACGGVFLEGDRFHTPEKVEKMRSGHPLNDEDRAGWLARLREVIVEKRAENEVVCLSCSALKERYRAVLRGDDSPEETVFVYLRGSAELLGERMGGRVGHYMPTTLLESQLRDLEEPRDAIVLDVARSPEELVAELRAALGIA
jgi:gluconokinase